MEKTGPTFKRAFRVHRPVRETPRARVPDSRKFRDFERRAEIAALKLDDLRADDVGIEMGDHDDDDHEAMTGGCRDGRGFVEV